MSGFDIENAIRFLVSIFPQEPLKKPSLFHSIRVASYLYLRGYSSDICIAGLLHDSLEDTSVTEEELSAKFGAWVAGAVKANSKNTSLPKEEILKDIVQRCIEHSEGALIVKSADVLDNFSYYMRCKSEGIEVEGEILRCRTIAKMISDSIPKNYTDPIFAELFLVTNRVSS